MALPISDPFSPTCRVILQRLCVDLELFLHGEPPEYLALYQRDLIAL